MMHEGVESWKKVISGHWLSFVVFEFSIRSGGSILKLVTQSQILTFPPLFYTSFYPSN